MYTLRDTGVPVSLYNVSKLYIHFQSLTFPRTGFRLDFSFHALSALPQQLSDGRWNCSVPHWPDFRLHFPCNLVSDCVGGEDEVDCPYTSHVCGPGFQSANGTCLQFVKTEDSVSWETAAETCKSRGMLLMTANTPSEWEAFRDLLLRYFRDPHYVVYGLKPSSSSLPYMYKHVLVGVDERVNYLLPVIRMLGRNQCIGVRVDSNGQLTTSTAACSDNFWSWFVCKFAVSGDDTLPQMPVSLTANWASPLPCIPNEFRCDDFWHCPDGSDERTCEIIAMHPNKISLPPPAIIDIDLNGFLMPLKPLTTTQEPLCPETHFQCPLINDFYCLPVYVRCNGVFDCPGKQDETACDTYTCPGYYRCRSSHVCLHPDHVCDGWSQCPEGDDELLCRLSCPDTCVCHGLAFTCKARFAASSYLELRDGIADHRPVQKDPWRTPVVRVLDVIQ
ncbi:hypothetical protein C0Q70_02429 [Pomacea canaliculata]|uniref:C-type lectin domain-containing protein n=1 Tax=Pomacea canaliculata TaxID=400727 RepID=A0A2T7PPW2_POMCA|nr:hypothetical protein C0Q70_02429 [Pomacea canaliculata]